MDGQVCFYRRSFADPVKPRWSTTGSMEPLRGTNKATCCVKLLPTIVYVYQVDCGCFCALLSTHFSQHFGPHSGPSFTLRAAPAHLASQEPLCDLLICFPPSNLHLMFMYPSAKFVVKFPRIEMIVNMLNIICFTYLLVGWILQLISQQFSEYHISFADQVARLALDY